MQNDIMYFTLCDGMLFDCQLKTMLSKLELIRELQQIKISRHLKLKQKNWGFPMIGIEK
jgi:hypothetical protein